MHFEILVEDQSGKRALDFLVPKIVAKPHTFRVISWEMLADAVFRGGAAGLRRSGWQAVGKKKSEWAERIASRMDIDRNSSPSFQYFLEQVRALAQ